jgi:hypothetical protein
MKRSILGRLVLGLALAAVVLPNAGCRKGRGGSYTDVAFGIDFPSFGGFEETFEEFGFFDSGFHDDGGYSFFEEEEYWEEDWKGKKAGRRK